MERDFPALSLLPSWYRGRLSQIPPFHPSPGNHSGLLQDSSPCFSDSGLPVSYWLPGYIVPAARLLIGFSALTQPLCVWAVCLLDFSKPLNHWVCCAAIGLIPPTQLQLGHILHVLPQFFKNWIDSSSSRLWSAKTKNLPQSQQTLNNADPTLKRNLSGCC